MKSIRAIVALASFYAVLLTSPSSQAMFHLIQLEQVIGGVNGNTAPRKRSSCGFAITINPTCRRPSWLSVMPPA